jgi:hypothetical protein
VNKEDKTENEQPKYQAQEEELHIGYGKVVVTLFH